MIRDKGENEMFGMNLEIKSLNNTSYKQKFLLGTVLDGVIVHNSFVEVKPS